MENPVVVEVSRGGRVESAHRGAFAIVDGAGTVVDQAGLIDAPVFGRSAIKVFQAIPLIEMGAADRFALTPEELSLACASHSGEPRHTEIASGMLAKAGLAPDALECGCHWPFDMDVALDLARSGTVPTALHNNCSGKHAGFLCTAVHQDEATKGYVGAEHPVQQRARDAIADLTGASLSPDVCGIDGCSIPTYAAPLKGFAYGFAKLVAGTTGDAGRAKAGRRLIEACMAHPWAMSGTDRACLRLIEAMPGAVMAKTGAEGVYCGALPGLGLGFALKIDDGGSRASEALCAAVVARAFAAEGAADTAELFRALAQKTLRNWEKTMVGAVRAVV